MESRTKRSTCIAGSCLSSVWIQSRTSFNSSSWCKWRSGWEIRACARHGWNSWTMNWSKPWRSSDLHYVLVRNRSAARRCQTESAGLEFSQGTGEGLGFHVARLIELRQQQLVGVIDLNITI